MKNSSNWNFFGGAIVLVLSVSSIFALPQKSDYGSESDIDLSPPQENAVSADDDVTQSSTDANADVSAASETKPVKISEESLQNLDQQSDYEPANYDFKYQIHGGGNYFGHQESRRVEKTVGEYHVLLPDGRKQTVKYFADETGYHPIVTYELVQAPLADKPQEFQLNLGTNNNNEGYRPKRRTYRHGKRVLKAKFAATNRNL